MVHPSRSHGFLALLRHVRPAAKYVLRVPNRWGIANHRLTVAALVLVVGARTLVSVRGYLYADDFAFRYWAATEPLNLDYLTRSYGGHVNPIGLLNQWVLQHLFPGSHLALALFSAVLWGLTQVFAAMLMRRITDSDAVTASFLLLVGLSLFGFESSTWWAASIYAAPYQLFLVVGTYLLLRARDAGNSRPVWAALLCAVAASLSFSRGFMAAVFMFVVVAAVPTVRSAALGARRAWTWQRPVWIGMGFASVLGVLLVIASSGDITRSGFDPLRLPAYIGRMLTLNVLPAIWGGPWQWFEIPPPEWPPIVTNPSPPPVFALLATVATIAGCVAIWWRRRELRGLVAWALAFVLCVLVIAGLARSGTAVESTAYRYTFDVVWPVALAFVLGVSIETARRRRLTRLGAVLVLCVSVSAVVSTLVPARDWMGNQARVYMANAASGFPLIPEGQTVLNQGVPEDLIHPGLMAPYANAEVVMTPVPGAPTFGTYAADRLFGFDSDGNVREQTVLGPTSLPGPDANCGYAVTTAPRSVPLDGDVTAWDFYARVAYFTQTATDLNMAVGGAIHTVPVEPGGLSVVYFPVNGPAQDVLVSIGTPGITVCVTDIRIGNRADLETGDTVPLPVTQLPP